MGISHSSYLKTNNKCTGNQTLLDHPAPLTHSHPPDPWVLVSQVLDLPTPLNNLWWHHCPQVRVLVC